MSPDSNSSWKVAGVSVTGFSHQVAAEPRCDDAHLIWTDGDWLVAVVSDGAGSAPHGAVGSRLLCEHLVKVISAGVLAAASETGRLPDDVRSLVINGIEETREHIRTLRSGVDVVEPTDVNADATADADTTPDSDAMADADAMANADVTADSDAMAGADAMADADATADSNAMAGAEAMGNSDVMADSDAGTEGDVVSSAGADADAVSQPTATTGAAAGEPANLADYHATLAGVVAGPDGGTFFHIGDGACIASAAGCTELVISPPENGEYANETYFFTMSNWREHLRFVDFGAEQNCVMLLSDGVTPFSVTGKDATPSPGFFNPLVDFLASHDRAEGEAALRATFERDEIRKITGDDKTLVWAMRSKRAETLPE